MTVENPSELQRRNEIYEALSDVRNRMVRAANQANRSSEEIHLIAVSKTHPLSDLLLLEELGISDFAENRESEGFWKSTDFLGTSHAPIKWHFQGKIQSNKIKSLTKWAAVIHSLDEARHVPLIAKAIPFGKTMDIFLQVNLDPQQAQQAQQAQQGRGGVHPKELSSLAESVRSVSAMRLLGIMAVAPLGENPESAFSRLAEIHADFKAEFPASPFLSAGMSGDFEFAIAHGATHIRVGSSILGSRAYKR